jgi:hypothetical protein
VGRTAKDRRFQRRAELDGSCWTPSGRLAGRLVRGRVASADDYRRLLNSSNEYISLYCHVSAHPQAIAAAHKYVRESGHVALLTAPDRPTVSQMRGYGEYYYGWRQTGPDIHERTPLREVAPVDMPTVSADYSMLLEAGGSDAVRPLKWRIHCALQASDWSRARTYLGQLPVIEAAKADQAWSEWAAGTLHEMYAGDTAAQRYAKVPKDIRDALWKLSKRSAEVIRASEASRLDGSARPFAELEASGCEWLYSSELPVLGQPEGARFDDELGIMNFLDHDKIQPPPNPFAY